jgi:PAS domain S-box-containing protein
MQSEPSTVPRSEKSRVGDILAAWSSPDDAPSGIQDSQAVAPSSDTVREPGTSEGQDEFCFQGILDSVEEVLFLLDPDGTVRYINATIVRLIGKPAKEVTGRPLAEFVHPEDHPLLRRYIAAALRGEHWPQEFRLLHADGSLTRARAITQRFMQQGSVKGVSGVFSDMEGEQSLRTLSVALDQSPASVIVTNAAGEIEFVNRRFVEVTGYALEEVKGKNPRFLKSGLTPALTYEQMWAALDSGNDWYGEFLNRKRNGELVLEEVHVSLVRDSAGRTTHYVSTHQNVTSRKLAEEQLRDSEQRYRILLNTVGDALFMVDQKSGRILDCNAASEKMYGYSREEMLSQRVVDLSSEPYATSLDTANPPPRIHLRYHCRRDGTVFPVEISNGAYTVGGRTVIISSIRDITKRIQNEELLQQTTRRNAVILETAIEGFYILDEKGRITDANASLCRMLKYTPDEIKSLVIGDIDAMMSHEEIMTAMADLSGDPVFFETRQRRKDNVVIDVEVRAQRVEIEGQRMVFCSARNITERKRAREALETSLHEKEVLLKEVHHRVKNNLQIISSLLSLQSRQVKDPSDLVLFTESQNRVRTMALIHERLYRSGDLTHVGMKDYVESLTSALVQSNGAAAPGCEVAVEVIPANLTFDISMCVPTGLVVTELVTNALKYAFPGGRSGKVIVHLEQDIAGVYRLSVADNGVGLQSGIDYRNTSTLGMQLVLSLAEQLGGTVTLDRSMGTKFTVTFARPEPPAS